MQVVGRPSLGVGGGSGGDTGGGGRRSSTGPDIYSVATMVPQLAWCTMYTSRPSGSMSLFQLEGLIARRMELLAAIDQLLNSPKTPNTAFVIDQFARRLEEEKRTFRRAAAAAAAAAQAASSSTPHKNMSIFTPTKSPSSAPQPSSDATDFSFSFEEDLVSHLLCRFAFCMSDKWRTWFIRMEEILLRARLQCHGESTKGFLESLLAVNELPCELVDRATDPAAAKLAKFIAWRNVRDHHKGGTAMSDSTEFLRVPMHIVPKMVRNREVLVLGGLAYVEKKKITEVFVNIFKYNVGRGVNDAWKARSMMLAGMTLPPGPSGAAAVAEDETAGGAGDETAESNLMALLDSFLTHFVAEPVDRLQSSTEGSVRPGDVQPLAKAHMPLCMMNIDTHLRAHGHLKHHGRFQYGLFLKAIGLSMEDALQLFATLMSVHGGGSLEAFSKSAYGYNIRHSYGREGKKTSYTSLSCASVVAMPPTVDKLDCHGCPFRFKDEAKLRELLAQPRTNPHSPATLPKVAPSPADIEDIVSDAKQMHYTRACYKYFMSTHDGVRRDGLFRSPFEYFAVSREHEVKPEGGGGDAAATGAGQPGKGAPSLSPPRVGTKRTLFGTAASPPSN